VKRRSSGSGAQGARGKARRHRQTKKETEKKETKLKNIKENLVHRRGPVRYFGRLKK